VTGTSNDARSIAEHVLVTPVRRLTWLESDVGRPVFAKLENHQVSGSFKFRGAMSCLAQVALDRRVITASAGNHALAVAAAAAVTGHEVIVCLPHTASAVKRRRLSAFDIGIIEHGGSLDEASAHARELADRHDLEFVSPYNDARVIAGQATVCEEFVRQVPALDAVLVPVGGGGLLAGCVQAARSAGSPATFVGCQPADFHPFEATVRHGEARRHVPRPSAADGLVLNPDDRSITYVMADAAAPVMLVDEERIAAGIYALLHNESLLIEGAGAIGIGALLGGARPPGTGPVGVILSGGNITAPTLAASLTRPFRQAEVRRRLGLQGELPHNEIIQRGARLVAHPSAGPPDGAAAASRVEGRVEEVTRALDDFDRYTRLEGLVRTDRERSLTRRVLAELDGIVEARAATADRPATTVVDQLARDHELERLERLALVTAAFAEGLVDWQSPSYAQSVVPTFGRVSENFNSGVNYSRYGSPAVIEREAAYLEVLGFDGTTSSCLLTSSGMTAYGLIEAFLLRHVIDAGDTVLLPHYVYFEAAEQICQIPHVRIECSDALDVDGFLADIVRTRPTVVFADPMTNTAELDVLDVCELVRSMDEVVDRVTWVVIDGTMLSGAFDPLAAANESGRVRVLYYESGSKYLQLGLDLTLVGLVVIPLDLRSTIERIRRNAGLILTPDRARLLPAVTRDEYVRRLRRMTDNAVALGGALRRSDLVADDIVPVFPGLPTHPGHASATAFAHLGGLMTIRCARPGLEQRHVLEALIERMLHVARENRVPLTKGVSFGFSVPRVSAASAMAEGMPPFLRLSVGVQDAEATSVLADVIEAAVAGFVATDLIAAPPDAHPAAEARGRWGADRALAD